MIHYNNTVIPKQEIYKAYGGMKTFPDMETVHDFSVFEFPCHKFNIANKIKQTEAYKKLFTFYKGGFECDKDLERLHDFVQDSSVSFDTIGKLKPQSTEHLKLLVKI